MTYKAAMQQCSIQTFKKKTNTTIFRHPQLASPTGSYSSDVLFRLVEVSRGSVGDEASQQQKTTICHLHSIMPFPFLIHAA